MIVIHDVKQGSPEWHKLHDKLWTGSRALPMLQGKSLPEWGSFSGNRYTKRGQILEDIAIAEFERETGITVLRAGFITNSKYPNAGYSPDGITGDTLLEVKCLNGPRHEKLVEGDIPIEYMAQIYFGMVICELKFAKLIAFNPEYAKQLTIIDIDMNKRILKNIKDKLLA